MSLEERKLRLIQLCMDLDNEGDLLEMEEAIENVELNRRARSSEQDIQRGRVENFENFHADIKEWMEEKRRTA